MIMSLLASAGILGSFAPEPIARPVRTEVVNPIRNATFNKGGKAKQRVQGEAPKTSGNVLSFIATTDGNRQVDPQVAVGGGFVLHGTNNGITIYDKEGRFVDGVPQVEFNHGIDPKMYFDIHNRIFVFDLWKYWDEEKIKPVNISVSETSDPRGAWNTYPVSASQGVDGGGIGYSRKWIGYSFPGGPEQTFVAKVAEMKAGKPATIYHFAGSLGHPIFNQDKSDDLYFLQLDDKDLILRRVGDDGKGVPVVKSVTKVPHNLPRFGWPPQSPMKGTEARTASGDRNPKLITIMNGSLWFSQTIEMNGRAAVQWNQYRLDGSRVQGGIVADAKSSYIETTLAVNKRSDLILGFQETGPHMFISPRFTYRLASDPKSTMRPIQSIGEGLAATEGGAWGDYSGGCIDGDNLVDLWTVQSMANDKGRGNTVIARLKLSAGE